MTATIGRWNPAWGPEPARVERRVTRTTHRSVWHYVWCPRRDCRNHEGALVHVPIVRDGEAPPERYACAACGHEMRVKRARRA